MPNKRKRTAEDRKRTRLARAIQKETGMKYTDALREVDRRLEELLRADAVINIDDDLDDDDGPPRPAGAGYPDPEAVLAELRQPTLPGGTVF